MDFDRLAARHKDAVYRQMVRVCGNYEDAEDVLVEALLAAYRHAQELRDEESFRAWLATIGRRVCGKMRRREALRPLMEMDALEASPQDLLEIEELKNCVRGAVESLPEGLREVYRRRELEGQSGKTVARDLGLTLPAMKTRLHRARTFVRENLDRGLCSG